MLFIVAKLPFSAVAANPAAGFAGELRNIYLLISMSFS
jgi:hypothetical protein